MAAHGSDSSETPSRTRRTTRRIRRTDDEATAAPAASEDVVADAEATEAPRRRTRRTRTTEETEEAAPAPAPARPRRSRSESARSEAPAEEAPRESKRESSKSEGSSRSSRSTSERSRAERSREESSDDSSFGEGLLEAMEVETPKRGRRREEPAAAPASESRRAEPRAESRDEDAPRRTRRSPRSRTSESPEPEAPVRNENAHDREWFEREPLDFDADVPPERSASRESEERPNGERRPEGQEGYRGRRERGPFGRRRGGEEAAGEARPDSGRGYAPQDDSGVDRDERSEGDAGDQGAGDRPSGRSYGEGGYRDQNAQGEGGGDFQGGRRRRRRRRRGGGDRGFGGEGFAPRGEGYAPREGQDRPPQDRPPQDRPGQDRPPQDRAGQERFNQDQGPEGAEGAEGDVEFFPGGASYGGNEGGPSYDQNRPYEGNRGYSQNRPNHQNQQNQNGPGGNRRRRRRGRGGEGQQNMPQQNGRRGNDSMQTSRRRTRGGQPGRGQQFQGQGRERVYRERSVPQHWHNNDAGGEVTGTFDGVLELHSKGFGFLRDPKKNYFAADADPFVTGALVEKYKLREGVMIHGGVGPGTRGQGPRLKTIETIDGRTPEEYAEIKHFDDLTPINPFEQIKLETGPKPVTMRVMDLLTPIGKGQRALIVAPPRSGKTMLLQDIADAVSANHPELHLIVVLIDERPEEVTELKRRVRGEVIASSMDRDVENHIRVSQLIFERAKRLVEAGGEVFVLLDSITRLGRAFNKGVNTGRTTQGGIDVRALDIPRKLFGTARRFDEGGSLTVVGTALIDTGSKGDEVIFQEFKGTGNMELVLSRQLADRRIWPAMDISMSGTRREEKILPQDVLEGVTMLRRSLVTLNPVEAMEQLIRTLERFPSNKEFLAKVRTML
jgi:transcription termination factor Rho